MSPKKKLSAIVGSPRRRMDSELSERVLTAIRMKAANATGEEAERLQNNLSIIKNDVLLSNGYKSRGRKSGATIITMPLDTIDRVLELGELTYKDFVEIVMDENKDNIEGKFSGVPDAPWVNYELPTDNLKEFADAFKSVDGKIKTEITELISALLPVYYDSFMNSMRGISAALYGVRDKIENIDICEKNIDNPYQRIKFLSEYKYNLASDYAEKKKYQQVMSEVAALDARSNYWLYTYDRVVEVTRLVSTTPHWFMFGEKPAAVLMDSVEDEFILDRFSFLSEHCQRLVLQTMRELQNKNNSVS